MHWFNRHHHVDKNNTAHYDYRYAHRYMYTQYIHMSIHPFIQPCSDLSTHLYIHTTYMHTLVRLLQH